jgi:hypothetical protein
VTGRADAVLGVTTASAPAPQTQSRSLPIAFMLGP